MMNGMIFDWYYTKNVLNKWEDSIPKEKNQTVTSLKIAHKTEKNEIYLLASNSKGEMKIYKEEGKGEDCKYSQLFKGLGHFADAELKNENFGSLHKYAEIWSTSWCCNEIGKLATVSEDQTCKVWEYDEKGNSTKEIKMMKDHTLAVTCADWEKVKAFDGEVLAICSDDRRISLYNPLKDFAKIGELTTSFLKEWHTLTYIALEENGDRIATSTQHGYLCIWNLNTLKPLFIKKVQHGGIEGLKWRGDLIATCSSDCSLVLFKINK